MVDINLEQYNDRELKELREKIDTELQARMKKNEKDAVERIMEIAMSVGKSIEELLGFAKKEKKKTPVKVRRVFKYQNPENPRQKWTGAGKEPAWLTALKEEGRENEAVIEREPK